MAPITPQHLYRAVALALALAGPAAFFPGGGVADAKEGGSGGSGGGGSGGGHGGEGRGSEGRGGEGEGEGGREGRDDGTEAGSARRSQQTRSLGLLPEGRDAIEITYKGGWRERVQGGRYDLRDPSGRLVVERRARPDDVERLRQLQR